MDSYILKYSLTQNGVYLEQGALTQYLQIAQDYFATHFQQYQPDTVANTVQVKYLAPSDPLVLAVIIISTILLALTVATMAMVYLKRDTPIIKSASPAYCLMILLGLILAYLTFIPYIGEPTHLSCMAPVVLGSMSFSLVFGYGHHRTNSNTRDNRI